MIRITKLCFLCFLLIGCVEEINSTITMKASNLDYYLCVPAVKRSFERGDTLIFINKVKISNVKDSEDACKKDIKNTIEYKPKH